MAKFKKKNEPEIEEMNIRKASMCQNKMKYILRMTTTNS